MRIYLPAAALALLLACASPEAKQASPAQVPIPPSPPPGAQPPQELAGEASVQSMLSRIRDAYARGDYERGLALVKEILSLGKGTLSTYDRLGSTYFALGRYGEALTIWEKALQMEKNPERRKALADSVSLARSSLGLGEPAAQGTPDAAPAPAAKPRAPAKLKPPDPAEIKELHRKGVEYYANGEYLAAATVYMRILALDPEDAQAKKALERLRMKQ